MTERKPVDFPDLVTRMRTLAADPRFMGHRTELNTLADQLRDGIIGLRNDDDGLRKFVGAWARARRLWCNLTGEDLV